MSYISEPVYKVSADWIGLRSNEALATFVLWSLDNLLVDLVSQQATLKGSKKAVQQSPTKGQVISVGLSMFSSLYQSGFLTTLPLQLFAFSDDFKEEKKFSSFINRVQISIYSFLCCISLTNFFTPGSFYVNIA